MIEVVEKAAIAAGDILLKYFSPDLHVSYKTSHNDLLTTADTESQKIIQQTITEYLVNEGYSKNDLGFLGEEDLSVSGKYQFIIDPLDGTNNFASGFKYFCVSIAVALNKSIIIGVIYDPIHKIIYKAEKGKGSYKKINGNQTPLSVLAKPLQDSLVSFLFSKDSNLSTKQLVLLSKILPKVRGLRSLHATALDICLCSDNVFQVSHHPSTKIWDIAAAQLIFEEAGGVVVDQNNKPIQLDSSNKNKNYFYIACCKDYVNEWVKLLSIL